MKVSIITVCFNTAETIEDTIRSVLNQQYEDIEYIVVDGGSVDDTLEVLTKHRIRISKLISEPDKGIYDAMNKGIRVAEGKIIAFLNAGDTYCHDMVVRDVVTAMETKGLEAVYGDLVYVSHSNANKVKRVWRAGEYKKGAFYYGWVPPHPAFFCRRYLFDKFGYFNSNYRIAADFELMLRFIERYQIEVGYIPRPLIIMRTGGRANTIRGVIRGNYEIIDAFRINDLKISLNFFWLKPVLKLSQYIFKR